MGFTDLNRLMQAWGEEDPEEAFATAFDSFFANQKPMFSLGEQSWTPPTDICEFPDRVEVKMEVGGVDEKDLEITVDKNLLRVRGRRERPQESKAKSKSATYHLMEIRHGAFERVFGLPSKLSMDSISATYRDGFLVIEIPKQRRTKRRSIPIEGE